VSRRQGDTTRMIEFALDVGGRLTHALSDALPEEAKRHLLVAQRELITALVIMYEHQAGNRRAAVGRDIVRRRSEAAGDDDDPLADAVSRPLRRTRGAAAKKPRSTRIEVE